MIAIVIPLIILLFHCIVVTDSFRNPLRITSSLQFGLQKLVVVKKERKLWVANNLNRFPSRPVALPKEKLFAQNQQQFQRLKESLGNSSFVPAFVQLSSESSNFNNDRKHELTMILKEWNQLSHNDKDLALILRNLEHFGYSALQPEDKSLIDELQATYLQSPEKSAGSFALFLIALKKLQSKWEMMSIKSRQETLVGLKNVLNDNTMSDKIFSELLTGIERLQMPWYIAYDLDRVVGSLLEQLLNLFVELNDLKKLTIFHATDLLLKLGKLVKVYSAPVPLVATRKMKDALLEVSILGLNYIQKERYLPKKMDMVSENPFILYLSFLFVLTDSRQVCKLVRGLSDLGLQRNEFPSNIRERIISEVMNAWMSFHHLDTAMTLKR
jgi:hypothetical protein